jgi:SAM-dependent methyltransferase
MAITIPDMRRCRGGGKRIRAAAGGNCRVCREGGLVDFAIVDDRRYERCPVCFVTLVAVEDLPTSETERRHNLNHENDIRDPGYRRFASKLVEPLASAVDRGAHGLDYGCGTGPVAATMLRELGFEVELFDPFFAPNRAALAQTYDFVICSEVVEHFHEPADQFDRLSQLLRSGGVLGVMTCFQTDDDRFAQWHYRRDPTHVAFYREETLRRIAELRGWTCDFPVKDVALFTAL